MADYSKKDLLQLIKRIGAYLSTKVSKILNIQDLRSFWAIAGFAVAVIFTWRALRTPNGSQRRQPKRQSPSHNNQNSSPSGVTSSSQDSTTQNATHEFFPPANATLGQIVRQRLNDGRKVTCRLLGVILEENTPEELQNQATVRSSVLEVLSEITKYSDLYLMERVLDDESEKRVLTTLEEAGVFTSGGLVKEKVLFCGTENGRMSFVRQLEPDWHIDSNPEITSQLARFIRQQVHISTKTERIASNIESCGPDCSHSSLFSEIFIPSIDWLWVSICFKNQTYVHKIHILMGALLVVVTIDLICGPADPNFMKIDGWNVVFYPIKFTRAVLFFTVVVLIGAGWSFMRPFLPLKDRIVLLLVILLNVASILLWEINPFHQDRQTWASWVFWVDVVCWFCLLLFPIGGTRIWLQEVCYGDVRNFAKIEEELIWFDKALLLALFYFYHWRLGVSAARVYNPSPPYPDVVLSRTEEIFSILFCMAIFYMLRPRVHQYYFLHIEDEIEGIKTDRVSFSYPKLPEDFEWSS
ncbi:hypothetical protein LXL04_025410 [Taraxacum kok-saghyz]